MHNFKRIYLNEIYLNEIYREALCKESYNEIRSYTSKNKLKRYVNECYPKEAMKAFFIGESLDFIDVVENVFLEEQDYVFINESKINTKSSLVFFSLRSMGAFQYKVYLPDKITSFAEKFYSLQDTLYVDRDFIQKSYKMNRPNNMKSLKQ